MGANKGRHKIKDKDSSKGEGRAKKKDKVTSNHKHGKTSQAKTESIDLLAWAGPDFEESLDPSQRELLADLYRRLDERLSGHRLQHVRSVALTARRLAHSHGVDPFLAQVAGILHDWDKKLSPQELWAKVDRYKIDLPSHDERQLPVLHGLTAAASLRQKFDLPEEVFSAIAHHTIGAADMSALDMVVYCSDMLEPLRGPRMDHLRRRALGPLDVLYAACQQSTLLYLVGAGLYISPQALDAWNACCDVLSSSTQTASATKAH